MDIDLKKYKKLNPIDDKVFILKSKKSNKTDSGVFIPDTAKGQEDKGIIVAVGPGMKEITSKQNKKTLLTEEQKYQNHSSIKRIGMELKPGDVVLYTPTVGLKINFEGDELIIQRESDILSVINE